MIMALSRCTVAALHISTYFAIILFLMLLIIFENNNSAEKFTIC